MAKTAMEPASGQGNPRVVSADALVAVRRDMLRFAQAHHIQPMVEVMPMSKVNDAIERVKHNQARYRIVLVNDLE